MKIYRSLFALALVLVLTACGGGGGGSDGGGSVDSCLVGLWTMDAYAINNKLLDLTSSPTLLVIAPSLFSLEFRADGSYDISGQLTVRSEIPGGSDYIEMDALHQGMGTFTARGGRLAVVPLDYQVTYVEMRAMINGNLNAALIDPENQPEIYLGLPDSASYRCSGNRLTITYDGLSGPVTEEWSR